MKGSSFYFIQISQKKHHHLTMLSFQEILWSELESCETSGG